MREGRLLSGFLVLLCILYVYSAKSQPKQNSKFGPIIISMNYVEACKSAGKLDPDLQSDWKMNLHKLSRTKQEMLGYIYLPKDTKFTKAVITGYELKNGGYKPYYKLDSKNPCSFKVLDIITDHFKILNEKTCTIKAGNYTIDQVNTERLMQLYGGLKFFYKKSLFELNFLSDVGSVLCLRLEIETKPPPTDKEE